MSKSVLFYSNQCKHSLKALEIIKKNNINIKLVSVNNKNITLPSFLKVVPTIIEQGSNQPLEGDFVFKWLNKYNKQESSNLNSQVQPKETNQLQDDAKIQPFFSNEMSGYSDGYSYINNENPMDHSFQFINGIENKEEKSFSSNNSTNSTSAKEDEFNKQYEVLMQQRREEIPDALQRS